METGRVQPFPNILTLLMLPLAEHLQPSEVRLYGFDGGAKGAQEYWKYEPDVNYSPELQQTVREAGIRSSFGSITTNIATITTGTSISGSGVSPIKESRSEPALPPTFPLWMRHSGSTHVARPTGTDLR